ncbi:MAG: hypothetical protein COA54_01230 [Thiotrichaceae bacterium]|nr:MAG: hypothetical protein COA54_01230 [Thiotrichaceae bacterium]
MCADKINNKEPIDIIYIMGSGRSGSTLLSNMLGTQSDIVCSGEVYNYKNFFESAVSNKRLCSCGEKLDECGYWRSVREKIEAESGNALVDLKDTCLPVFKENNYSLFSAIKDVSNKKIIVDSSKRHYRLKLLLKSRLFRIVIVHLVRDARAYSYSNLLTGREKGKSNIEYYKKLLEWQKKNLGIKAIYGHNSGYIMIRYEDLVMNYTKELSRVMALCNQTFDESRLFDSTIRQSHEFSGNRRFISEGLKKVKLDTRYLESLTQNQWLSGSVLVAPTLAMFGYPVIKRSAPV